MLQKIYNKKPDYPNVAYYYGILLKNKGKNEEAISVLESVPLNEKHIDLEYEKGWLYYSLGNEKKSLECINKAIVDLTVNDNRYYLANSLLTVLLNTNQGNYKFASETDKFCDKVDGLISIETNIHLSNKYGEFPSSELWRIVDKIAALKNSAYFILSSLMYVQIKEGQYQGSLESFNNLTKYLQGPTKLYLNVTEENYLSLLSCVSEALSNLNKETYSDYQDVNNSLLSIEKHNIDHYKIIYELSHIIRTIYFNGNEDFIVKNSALTFKYNKIVNFTNTMNFIKIESPNYLVGDKIYPVNSIKEYRYTQEILIPINTHIINYHFLISGCDIHSNYSKTLAIFPYIKVIKH